MAEPFTVHQITLYIRDLFDLDLTLQDVWIEGEVSNFKQAASGHLYFTLKDANSELACVMWRSQAAQLSALPRHGDAVLVHGRIAVYEARGQYQLYCDMLQPAGVGELNRQFELLKAKLDAEGLFDAERKRALPRTPHRIGVVTSPTTAAFQDIQNVIRRRYPLVEILLSPAQVQGRDAAPQIIAALDRLNRRDDIDVILLARGGGSLEDLWCFNDEALVRAVAASRLPVVTGVGHEIDFTLVDFAADHRAPTPSAAAELLTPDGAALRQELRLRRDRLEGALLNALDGWRDRLEANQRWLERLSPAVTVQNARQRVDDMTGRMDAALRRTLERRRDRLDARARALHAASPDALLARGYAMVSRTADGRRVTSIQDAAEGTSLTITLHDGQLTATVRERRADS
ncbi:exodeoxyribonuclease VII large subunit [Aggregatilinea lenta]|uniref:exodeoxyribonuclease VII large subunit n=1 Tax=Aggregatilinea lenta TaxID=913108 RepID=UPI000E5B99CC|nr:exodeoxyribonuclease VII large subunit [Aggregatilinea lenta]